MTETADAAKTVTWFGRRAWLFAVGLVVAQTGLLIWTLAREYQQALETGYARLGDATRIADENISGSLRAIDLLLRDIDAEVERRGTTEAATLSEFMTTRARALPEVRTLVVTNAEGIITATTRPEILSWDVHDRPYYAEIRQATDRDQTLFSPLTIAKPTNTYVIFATRVIRTPDGHWAGIVTATLEMKLFHALLASIIPAGTGTILVLVGKDGRIISRQPDTERYVGLDLSKGGFLGPHRATGQKLSFRRSHTLTEGIDKIGAVRTIADGSFTVLATLPVSEALAPWRTEAIKQGIAFLVLSIAVLSLTWLAIRQHSRESRATAMAIIAQNARKESEDRLELATKGAQIGIWDYDLVTGFCVYNEEMLQLYGLDGDEHGITLEHWQSSVHADDRERAIEDVLVALRNEQPLDTEFRINRPDGTIRHVKSVAQVYRDQANQPIRMVGINLDITAIKQSELRLKEANEQLTTARDKADAANQAKSAFLAMMSHEIRTPITGVLGMADLLRRTPLNQEQAGYLDTLAASTTTLLTILNDVLDISKIEAGKVVFDAVEFNLHDAVLDTLALFKTATASKVLELVPHFGSTLSARVIGDPARFKQLLFNLTSNALKFTDHGGVDIRVSIAPHDRNRVEVMVEVEDTGIGIASDQLPLLFQPFTQLGATSSRRLGGTGLGLVITRRLVEMMGGTIGVDSRPGTGSRFWFSLPFRLPPDRAAVVAETAPPTVRSATRPLRILLAEDNPINQMLVRTMLQKSGHSVDVAGNGRIAVARVTAEPFDAVLMDMQMPEMDGEDATRAIRALPPPRNRVPIIALTADAMPEHCARYLAAGVNDLVAKPIDWDILMTALRTHTDECLRG